jgi:hypothetical protein
MCEGHHIDAAGMRLSSLPSNSDFGAAVMDQMNSTRQAEAAEGAAPAAALYRHRFAGEPALSDLLGDPIAKALMIADRVGHHDLDALLETARRHLRRSGAAPAVVRIQAARPVFAIHCLAVPYP